MPDEDRLPEMPLELNSWDWTTSGPLENIFMHLGWSMHLVDRLPKQIYDESLPWEVRGACLQAFLVNARLLTDFFLKRLKNDYSAVDLEPSWAPGPPELVESLLNGAWLATSEYVVHLSKKRIADGDYEPSEFDVSLGALNAIRDDLFELWEEWDGYMHELRLTHRLAGYYPESFEDDVAEDDY